MKKIIYRTGLIFLLSAALLKAQAQLSLSAQIRTRTEFRNGVGILKPKVNDPAFFHFPTFETNIQLQNKPGDPQRSFTGCKGVGPGCFYDQQCRWE